MTLPLWGLLQKSQDDTSTIDEAIAAAIVEHEADPTAHLGEGESLQAHKSEDVIDHPPLSVVADKYAPGSVSLDAIAMYGREYIQIFMESLDRWNFSGGFGDDLGSVYLQTGSTINTTQWGYPVSALFPDWDKAQLFQTRMWWPSQTNCTVYLVCGPIDPGDSEAQGYGFKIVNGTLYALHIKSDGSSPTEYTTEITGVSFASSHIYRCAYYPTEKIEFYVDGVLEATHTTNLPDSAYPGGTPCYISVKNTSAANKVVTIYPIYFQQDLA